METKYMPTSICGKRGSPIFADNRFAMVPAKIGTVPKTNLSLLIVDDHILLREGLSLMFRTYADAKAVGSIYQEATCVAEKLKPDVVIFGIGSKHSPNWATVQMLCNQQPTIRSLVLDETVRTRNIRTVLKLGIRGYWTKHATFNQIIQATRCLAAGEQSFCPEVDQYLFRNRHGLHYHPAHTGNPLQMLTTRETELLTLIVHGLTLKQCSQQMGISINTVDNHKTRLMRKLDVHKNIELVRLAVREGLVE
jgi:two-component system, NarL family, response regulator NreC